MNKALVVTGLSVVLAMLLSSPTFAQTAPQPANATPAPVAEPAAATDPAGDVPLDALIDQATTPAERTKLLLRCSGPPPFKQKQVADASKAKPTSKAALVADKPAD